VAVYPSATYRPLNQYSNLNTKPRLGAVLHVNESNGASLFDWISSNPSKPSDTQMSCHFQVAKDGTVEQYIDTDNGSWCQVGGNDTYVSIETEGFHTEALTTAQLNAVAGILGWLHSTYSIPLQLAETPGQLGFGWHGMGGTAWGGHFDCPGVRKDQRQAILDLTGAAIPAAPALGLSSKQQGYVQTIVSVVKARSLPMRAAIVAIEVALTESAIQMYANASNSASLALPHDAVGNDHGSVGLYQQQVTGAPNSTGSWGTTAELMDVSISTGKFLDSYVTKDQAQTNWQIAQAVQGSAFSDGSNYQKNDSQAQQIATAYWGSGGSGPPPSVSWVDCSSNNYFGTKWAADVGPYTGPWPLLASGVFDPGGEIDFYVGVPNPDGNPAHFADGTYSTDIFNAARWDNGDGTSGDYYWATHDDGTITSGPPFSNSMPTGAHLFVIAYPPYPSAPLHDPFFYVPPTYANGGQAAQETAMGHFSDRQEWTYTPTINTLSSQDINKGTTGDQSYTAGGSPGDTTTTATPSAGNKDITTMTSALSAGLQGYQTDGTFTQTQLMVLSAKKYWDNPVPFISPWDAGTKLHADGHTFSTRYNATGAYNNTNATPDPLNSLNYGTDYDTSPYSQDSSNGFRLESDANTILGWQTASGSNVDIPMNLSLSNDSAHATSISLPTGLKTALYAIPADSATDSVIFTEYPAGSGVNHYSGRDKGVDIAVADMPALPALPAPGSSASTTYNLTIPSSIGVTKPYMVLQVEWSALGTARADPFNIPDFPMPGYGAGGSDRTGYTIDSYYDSSGTNLPFPNMKIRIYRPYRYWVPGAIVTSTPASGGGGGTPPPPPPLPDGPPLPPPPKRVTHMGTGPETTRIHFW
jgi:hypothetical protein